MISKSCSPKQIFVGGNMVKNVPPTLERHAEKIRQFVRYINSIILYYYAVGNNSDNIEKYNAFWVHLIWPMLTCTTYFRLK